MRNNRRRRSYIGLFLLVVLSMHVPLMVVNPVAHAGQPLSQPRWLEEGESTGEATPTGSVRRTRKTMVFDTQEGSFRPGIPNQGWWSDNEDNQADNPGYVAGYMVGNEYRNFFIFDLRKLKRHVISATLRLNVYYTEGDDLETWSLYDVSTAPETLSRTGARNEVIFQDLGSGKKYGQYVIDTNDQDHDTIEVRLNRRALRDMNEARGGFFSLGGRLESLSGVRDFEVAFGISGDDQPVQLITSTVSRRRTPR